MGTVKKANIQIGVLWCGVFLHSADQGVSLCKLSREYFLLWVINMPLYGNTNSSALPVCTNKTTRDKLIHEK